ncbi:DUF3310 domain-containing protein [Paenibacillus vietnamensis]|uniref:DUF3310 domain-containing protein n=1 Tax=Paenibacillus vietnamensis TaxID=2590547 RepID=UPI001CD18D56|nr:DUF3310 domain-containing protein [Paenibacillus vietnamensis]
MSKQKTGPECGLTKKVFLEQLANGETISSIERAWEMKAQTLPYWVGKWGLKGITSEKARMILESWSEDDGTPLLRSTSKAAEAVEHKPTGLIAINESKESEQLKELAAKLRDKNVAHERLLLLNKELNEKLEEMKKQLAEVTEERNNWQSEYATLEEVYSELKQDRDHWKGKASQIETESQLAIAEIKDEAPVVDNVNHPSHYTAGGIETIDFIRAKLTQEEFAGYCKGNVLKYVARANHKGGMEDLSKAAKYLEFATQK